MNDWGLIIMTIISSSSHSVFVCKYFLAHNIIYYCIVVVFNVGDFIIFDIEVGEGVEVEVCE